MSAGVIRLLNDGNWLEDALVPRHLVLEHDNIVLFISHVGNGGCMGIRNFIKKRYGEGSIVERSESPGPGLDDLGKSQSGDVGLVFIPTPTSVSTPQDSSTIAARLSWYYLPTSARCIQPRVWCSVHA
jgi:hypothetical protein